MEGTGMRKGGQSGCDAGCLTYSEGWVKPEPKDSKQPL